MDGNTNAGPRFGMERISKAANDPNNRGDPTTLDYLLPWRSTD